MDITGVSSSCCLICITADKMIGKITASDSFICRAFGEKDTTVIVLNNFNINE